MTNARLIASYLPHFYPTAETDRWHGKGFTAWRAVAQARPLFAGHVQPHAPGLLGFYDLRFPDVRHAQAELARAHAIEGFCYRHYWFHGLRLFGLPFDEVLTSGQPDLPFCLEWANGPLPQQPQQYSATDDLDHVRWLLRAFADDRYITVHGRPLFIVSRPADLPNARQLTDLFRRECLAHGIREPYLIAGNVDDDRDYRDDGFDGTLDAQPRIAHLPDAGDGGPRIYDYGFARRLMARTRSFPFYPSAFVGHDDTANRADGIVLVNAKPECVELGLREIVAACARKRHEDRLVMLNAWNDWDHGCHLEPDSHFGLAHLEAVRRANVAAAAPVRT